MRKREHAPAPSYWETFYKYDQQNGLLIARLDRLPNPKHRAGEVVPPIIYNDLPYMPICRGIVPIGKFSTRLLYAHAIWCSVYGSYPEGTILHIDGDRYNLGFENLLDVPLQYEFIRYAHPENRKDMGVHQYAHHHTWKAIVHYGKGTKFVGAYQTKEEAITARENYIHELREQVIERYTKLKKGKI
jgi:hypothetical protein